MNENFLHRTRPFEQLLNHHSILSPFSSEWNETEREVKKVFAKISSMELPLLIIAENDMVALFKINLG